MSSEPEASSSHSSEARPAAPRRRSRRLTLAYALLVFILVNWILWPLLVFSYSMLVHYLTLVYVACVLVLVFLFLGALFRFWRRWKEVGIHLVILAIVLLPFYRVGDLVVPLSNWLVTVAFRVHVSPIEQYLARCDWVHFDRDGVRQSIGQCERFEIGFGDFSVILYDTTGEIMLPVSERTPEWKAAMRHFDYAPTYTTISGRSVRLPGNFYNFTILNSDP